MKRFSDELPIGGIGHVAVFSMIMVIAVGTYLLMEISILHMGIAGLNPIHLAEFIMWSFGLVEFINFWWAAGEWLQWLFGPHNPPKGSFSSCPTNPNGGTADG